MTNTTALMLLVVAIATIFGLGIYALKLYRQVATAKQALNEINAQKLKQKNETVDSLKLITTTALNKELNLTEACIRIAALMDSLDLGEKTKSNFTTCYTLAGATFDIPRNQAWKDLAKPKKKEYREKMDDLEQKLGNQITLELEQLLQLIKNNILLRQ